MVVVNVDESDQSKPALSSSSMTPATVPEDPLSRWVCSQTAERIFAITQNPKVANSVRSQAKMCYSGPSTGIDEETAVENIRLPRNSAVKGVKEKSEGKKSKFAPSDIVPRKAGCAAVRRKSVPEVAVTVIAAAVSTSGRKRGHQLRGAGSERTPEVEIFVSKRSRGSAVTAPQPVISARTRMTRMPVEEVAAVIPSCRSKRRSGCVDKSPAVDIIPIIVDEGIVSEFDDVVVAVKRGRGRPRKIVS